MTFALTSAFSITAAICFPYSEVSLLLDRSTPKYLAIDTNPMRIPSKWNARPFIAVFKGSTIHLFLPALNFIPFTLLQLTHMSMRVWRLVGVSANNIMSSENPSAVTVVFHSFTPKFDFAAFSRGSLFKTE